MKWHRVGVLLVCCTVAGCVTAAPSFDGGGGASLSQSDVPGGETPAPDRCVLTGGDLEGCFAYEQMFDFLDAAYDHAQEWLTSEYGGTMPMPEVSFMEEGRQAPEGCVDENGAPAMHTDLSYEHCGPDGAVYIGQRSLWQIYSEQGDAGAVAGLVHEIGHHLQWQAGVTAVVDTLPERITAENQADCVAGAWIAYADTKGYLVYPDDIDDAAALVVAIASSENDPNRDHGTVQERANAMDYGITNGLLGCNGYFPGQPLVVP